jgi:hypothetical protein
MSKKHIRRVLALDIRAQRFGYAVFEASPVKLLDWGVRSMRMDGARRGAWHIADLLRMYQPSAVVFRRIKAGGRRDTPGARNITHAIKCEARRNAVPVALVGKSALKIFFREYGKHTKHEIASALAAVFAELKWKLPPPRRLKFWRGEARRMSVFDAAALGIAFLALHGYGDAVRELLVNK